MTIISKTDAQKAYESRVMREFGGDPGNKEHKEYAEAIAAKTQEAYNRLNRMEKSR